MTLDEFNAAVDDDAFGALLACCGSEQWATRMALRRPFDSMDALHREANKLWRDLPSSEWRQAFSKHPRIGERSAGRWSTQEQEGMSRASESTATTIRDLNAEYELKFGYIFIVCATGKSADEMRTLLSERLTHFPEDELPIAAAEQAKIMHLRLDKMLLPS